MCFRPRRWPGALTGAGLLLILLSADVWLVIGLAGRTPDSTSLLLGLLLLLSVPLLAALGYMLYGLLCLSYEVNRNRVLIRWAASEQVVPLAQITRVIEGTQLVSRVHWSGVRWPGCMIGGGEIRGYSGGPVLTYATESLSRQLILITPSMSYAISPSDGQAFLAALAVRRQMGALESPEQEARHPSFLSWPLWRDRTLWTLALVGAVANGTQFAYLCCRYAALPQFLPLHFGPLGQPDRIGARAELFRLPLVGLLILLLDGVFGGLVHSRQRAAGYLLLGGALLMQMLLGLGLWKLTL